MCPQRASWHQAGPGLSGNHCKAIVIICPQGLWFCYKLSTGDLHFVSICSHLLVSSNVFCLIFKEWNSLIHYIFLNCIPHVFLKHPSICFFLHNCKLIYVNLIQSTYYVNYLHFHTIIFLWLVLCFSLVYVYIFIFSCILLLSYLAFQYFARWFKKQ